MPSGTPPHPSSHDPEPPTAETPAAGAGDAGPRRMNPRVQAALCYAFPIVPAAFMLLRERHNGFVRFHAARSLVLFGGIILTQVLIFAIVVVLGNTIRTAGVIVALGVIVLVAYLALAIGAFILWLRMLAEAMAGKGRVYPYLDYFAVGLESFITSGQRRVFRWLHARKESIPI